MPVRLFSIIVPWDVLPSGAWEPDATVAHEAAPQGATPAQAVRVEPDAIQDEPAEPALPLVQAVPVERAAIQDEPVAPDVPVAPDGPAALLDVPLAPDGLPEPDAQLQEPACAPEPPSASPPLL